MKRSKNELILFDLLFILMIVLIGLSLMFADLFSNFITEHSFSKLFYSIIILQITILFSLCFIVKKIK